MQILGYELVMTCGACPEQYDVFSEGGERVGYLRLRNGSFTAQHSPSGKEVYSASTIGDGVFDDGERDEHLIKAVLAINAQEVYREYYISMIER